MALVRLDDSVARVSNAELAVHQLPLPAEPEWVEGSWPDRTEMSVRVVAAASVGQEPWAADTSVAESNWKRRQIPERTSLNLSDLLRDADVIEASDATERIVVRTIGRIVAPGSL